MSNERIHAKEALRLLEEGRILRNYQEAFAACKGNAEPGSDQEGTKHYTLLGAMMPWLVPESRVEACPEALMPTWMAYVLYDVGRGEHTSRSSGWTKEQMAPVLKSWTETVRRYISVSARWHVLEQRNWHHVLCSMLKSVLSDIQACDCYNTIGYVLHLCESGEDLNSLAWLRAAARAKQEEGPARRARDYMSNPDRYYGLDQEATNAMCLQKAAELHTVMAAYHAARAGAWMEKDAAYQAISYASGAANIVKNIGYRQDVYKRYLSADQYRSNMHEKFLTALEEECLGVERSLSSTGRRMVDRKDNP